ncbi:O-antigen ligase family protein [Trichocoleus sp. ST-U3]
MLTKDSKNRFSHLSLWVGVAGVGVGIVAGLLAGIQPLLLGLAFVAVGAVVYFFASFEQAALGLLLMRSSLDMFSAQQLPAAFALGVDALTLLYVTVLLLTSQTVRTDGFWWFFFGWVVLQGLWVILLPLGALGLDASLLSDSIREWVRLFSLLMVYLLVMQLKDRVPPEKVIHMLFFSLVLPITMGLMQAFLPSLIPSFLSGGGGDAGSMPSEGVSRITGTFAIANTFATYLLVFMGLAWWRLGQSKQRLPWFLLLGLIAFFYVGTKSLFALIMLAVFVVVLIAPRLSVVNLIGGVVLFALVVGLFASSEFGQERLGSIGQTPLLNPDIDVWRAILLSQGDNNSFNWRLAQWHLELTRWRQYPIFGYGLGLSVEAAGNGFLPHNDYIRALVEGGVVGLTTFLGFFAAQVVHLVRLLRNAPRGTGQRELCLVLLAIILAISAGMITENIWSHTTLFFYWWIIFAVAGWDWNERPTEDSPALADPRFSSGRASQQSQPKL